MERERRRINLVFAFCSAAAATASRQQWIAGASVFATLMQAPASECAVHVADMAIEKESTGIPEVDIHKRTTKVNLSIIIGVVIFLAAMSGVVALLWFTNR